MNKEKNFASAVIYIRNAADRAEAFLKTVMTVLQENFERSEIICVNDFSDDDSAAVIRKAAASAETASVTIVNLSYFHGLEVAMNAGVDLAIGDFVFEFDRPVCDFDPSVIMQIYRHALEGYDIVSASPERKEKLSSRLFYRVFDRFSDLSYRMVTESFRVLSRRMINRIGSMNKSVPYRKAIYAGSGLKSDIIRYQPVSEIPAAADRKEARYRMNLAVDSLILFTELGYRFSMFMTVMMMVVSAFMILYSLIVYFFIHPIEGWTTTVLFLSVAFLGLFGILTIIVKYLQIIVNMIFRRKQYSFESIEKLS